MSDVITVADCVADSVASLLARFGLRLTNQSGDIQGSYWGDREAGLQGDILYARPDTPLHSVLHEACHYICMDRARRESLDRDAGGDYNEENAVCYLQIILADELPGFDRARMMSDMDAWGYTFRLGSARAWFEGDADDARQWLIDQRLIDDQTRVRWNVRS